MTYDLIGLLILWCLASIVTGFCLSCYLMAARAERERRTRHALATEAADHDEPARADVEAGWLFDADEFVPLAESDAAQRIRAHIAATHEREAERLRSELDCDAAVALWLGAR